MIRLQIGPTRRTWRQSWTPNQRWARWSLGEKNGVTSAIVMTSGR